MDYIKGVLAVLVVLAISCTLWNTPGCQQQRSHLKSGCVGLHRTVTLYGNDGRILRTWDAPNMSVEDKGGSFRLMVDGKAVTVSGTVVIEEK